MAASGPGGDRPGSRGKPVVDRVHRVTLERLAEVGFERLSIPEIAELAGLNKTSLYRRWPTKQDLVRDALMTSMHPAEDPPDTGSVRGDMLELARSAAEFVTSPVGMGALRTLLAEGVVLDVGAPGGVFGGSDGDVVARVMDRGVERGELPRRVDTALVSSTIAGAVMHRTIVERQAPTDEYLEALIDLVLTGARSRARADSVTQGA